MPATAAHGSVDLIVEANGETPIAVPGRWGGKPVPLLRWRLTTTDRRVVRARSQAIGHRLTIPSNDRYRSEYGRWTRQNKRNRIGRYRFVLQAGWDTRTVTDGHYVVDASASDVSGNTGVARFPIRVANLPRV